MLDLRKLTGRAVGGDDAVDVGAVEGISRPDGEGSETGASSGFTCSRHKSGERVRQSERDEEEDDVKGQHGESYY
jgi:hypothetical protein